MLGYILYRMGQFLALSLPLKAAYRLAMFCSDVHYLFADKDRLRTRKNLMAIFPEKSDEEICRLRLSMFRNFAKYLVDFFRFDKLDKAYVKNNIKVENIHYFDQELAKGKGVIVVSAHLGSWELGGVVISLLGYPFWVVALPHKSRKVNEFFNYQRESKGIKVVPFGKAVRTCLKALKNNEMVGLVGDKDFAEKGPVVPFFGKPTYFPPGPASFAAMTGAGIVPGFMFRNEDDSLTLRIEKPIEYKVSGDNQKDMQEITRQYKSVIEDYVRRFPEQWFMFRVFWIDEKK